MRIWLMGGIGNNLFQYLAYLAAKEQGQKPILVRNLTEQNLITKILGWTIHENIFSILFPTQKVSSLVYYPSILRLLLFKRGLLQSSVHFDTLPITKNANIDVFGYFQTKEFISAHKKHFAGIRGLLHNDVDFDLAGKLVVHFRWGDSNWAKKWSPYYDSLVGLFCEFEEVVIVTDDNEVAQTRFGTISNVRIKEAGSALNDFQFLMSSHHLVCAPSTFSWWASQLAESPRVIYMPAFLYKKLGHHTKSELRIIS